MNSKPEITREELHALLETYAEKAEMVQSGRMAPEVAGAQLVSQILYLATYKLYKAAQETENK